MFMPNSFSSAILEPHRGMSLLSSALVVLDFWCDPDLTRFGNPFLPYNFSAGACSNLLVFVNGAFHFARR